MRNRSFEHALWLASLNGNAAACLPTIQALIPNATLPVAAGTRLPTAAAAGDGGNVANNINANIGGKNENSTLLSPSTSEQNERGRISPNENAGTTRVTFGGVEGTDVNMSALSQDLLTICCTRLLATYIWFLRIYTTIKTLPL